MPSSAIGVGFLLILVGVIGYIYGMGNGNASITALIPAFFGAVIAGLGVVARANENLRKHLMHAAVLVALIGFIVPTGRLLSRASEFVLTPATLSQIFMAVLCLIFVIMGIKSFTDARRNRVI